MNVEIRAASKEEMVDFRRVSNYVFGDNENDPTDEQTALVIPEWTTCAFVAFQNKSFGTRPGEDPDGSGGKEAEAGDSRNESSMQADAARRSRSRPKPGVILKGALGSPKRRRARHRPRR